MWVRLPPGLPKNHIGNLKMNAITKKIQQNLNEAKLDVNSYIKSVENVIKKYFPKSFISVSFSTNIVPSILVRFAIGKDKSEWSNGIWQNDPMWHTIHIGMGQIKKDGEIPEKLTAESPVAGNIMTKDFKRIKVGFRKKTGTPDQVLKHLDAFYKKAKQLFVANKDKIADIVKDKY